MLNVRSRMLWFALLLALVTASVAYADTPPVDLPEFEDDTPLLLQGDTPMLLRDDIVVLESGPVLDDDAAGPAEADNLLILAAEDEPVIILGRPGGKALVKERAMGTAGKEGLSITAKPSNPGARASILGSGAPEAEGQARVTDEVAAPMATGVYITSAWTADPDDPDGDSRTVFNAEEGIRYYARVVNNTGSDRTFTIKYYLRTPCASYYAWQGTPTQESATYWRWLDRTAMCPGTHTLTVSVTYGGRTTSKSSTFRVIGSGDVTASYAWTTDSNSDDDDSFAAGDDVIVWWGEIFNSTNRTKTANLRFLLATPCDESYLEVET